MTPVLKDGLETIRGNKWDTGLTGASVKCTTLLGPNGRFYKVGVARAIASQLLGKG